MVNVKKEGILLGPTEHKFEDFGVLNPGVIEIDGQIHLLYRATNHANYSTIGYCLLSSPTEIARRDEQPLMIPLQKYESHGIEDPRIVYIDDTFYITYTAYDGENALGALSTSKDLKTFKHEGLITPQISLHEYKLIIEASENLNEKYLRFVKLIDKRTGHDTITELLIWDKDVMFFPRKINDKFAFLHRVYPDIQIVYYDKLEDLTYQFWKDHLFHLKDHTLLSGKYPYESSYIGGGCPPIETEKGWLIIYHGVDDQAEGYVYHAAVSLMDLEDPQIEIGRLRTPLFSPDEEWEKKGVVNNVVFPTGAIIRGETLYIYYGAADKYIGVVSLNLEELINEIINPTV